MEEPGKIIFLNPFKPLYLKIYIVIFSLVIVKLSRLKVLNFIFFDEYFFQTAGQLRQRNKTD